MRKYLIIALAAMATMACAKIESNDSTTPNTPIRFSVVNRLQQTKATTGLEYPTDVPFGTFAWWTENNWTGAVADQSFVYMDNEQVSYQTVGNAHFWAPSTTYYWTKSGKLTFASYSPYTEAGNDNGYSSIPSYNVTNGFLFTNYTVVDATNVDLMYANLAANCTQNSNNDGSLVYDGTTGENATDHGYKGVPTIFNHALCRLGFEFRALGNLNPNVDKIKIELTGVSISNIDKTGSFTQTPAVTNPVTPRWSTVHAPVAPATLATYDFSPENTIVMEVKPDNITNRASVTYAHTNVYRILLPQALEDDDNPDDPTADPIATTTDQKLVITYNIKSHYKNTAENVWATENNVTSAIRLYKGNITEWKENQNITYKITINPYSTEAITFDPAVVDWTDVDSSDIVVTPPAE